MEPLSSSQAKRTKPNPQPGSVRGAKKLPNISSLDERTLQKVKDFLTSTESLNESLFVSPSPRLTEREESDKIRASALTIGSTGTHFVQTKLTESVLKDLQECLKRLFMEFSSPLISHHFLLCQAKIFGKLARCGNEIGNEAELHYVVGDSIMEMLCTIFPLQIRLEESISHQHKQAKAELEAMQVEEETTYPSSGTCSSVTDSSCATYTCYTLRNEAQNIVAVIIETKMQSHSKFHHSVAQAIGYYAALKTVSNSPPLVFVLSEIDVQLVMFPFVDNEANPLINAVRFPPMPLWLFEGEEEGLNMPVLGLLYTLLKICVEEKLVVGERVEYTNTDPPPVKKRAMTDVVLSQGDLLIESLLAENAQIRSQYAQMARELAELKRANFKVEKNLDPKMIE